MTAEERIQRIGRSVQDLIHEIERLPADLLYREPKPGEWAVMSTLAHVTEMLPYWAHQAQAVAAAPGRPFGRTHDDPQRIGALAEHGRDTLDALVPRLRAACDECVSTLRSLPDEGWACTGQHPSRGTMSVEQFVDAFLVSHVEEHSAQIRATLSQVAV